MAAGLILRALLLAGAAAAAYFAAKDGRLVALLRSGGSTAKPGKPPVIPMIRDPQCQLYVPASEAIRRQVDGRTVEFCSDACATEYSKKQL